MRVRPITILAAAFLCLAPPSSRAALSTYEQNFEGLSRSNPSALSTDGWLVYGNVYSPDHSIYLYGYGPFPAPNGSGAFCALDTLQGGPLQGNLQLSVYSDYNNTGAHGAGDQVESNVYREQTIEAADVGNQWTFQFDAKLGNLVPPSSAVGFIKTLNPAAGWALTHFETVDMSAIPATWNTYSVSLTIDGSLVGQVLQIGFANTASMFVSSGVFYDNLLWHVTGAVGVDPAGPATVWLGPAAPNPFAGSTRIAWSTPRPGPADLGVYDVGGRRVATLFTGFAPAGPRTATWDGRADDGRALSRGLYWCVLRTVAGTESRKLVVRR